MNNNDKPQEEALNLKDLFIYILKKWRTILIAMVAGAILLGAYKGILKPNTIQLSAVEQQNIQNKIDENEDLILKNSSTIKTNKLKISDNTQSIKKYKADLEVQKELVSNLEDIISTYKNAGSQAAESLKNVNIELASAKKKINSYEIQIEELEKENDELPKKNSNLQEEIYDLRAANKDLKASLSPQPHRAGISSIIKYGVLGAIIGFFIIYGVEALRFVLNKKLRNSDSLMKKYNIRVIGCLHTTTESGKKKQNYIDRLIDKWAGYNNIDVEKQYKLISAAIQVMSSSKNEQIILTGTVDHMFINHVGDKLKELLPQDSYPICVAENPVYDADSLLSIKEGRVILVEALDTSNIYEIDKILDFLHIGNAEILGAIVL